MRYVRRAESGTERTSPGSTGHGCSWTESRSWWAPRQDLQLPVGRQVSRWAAAAGALRLYLVSLNTATVEQLDTLPGVGPVLAQHIVDYRTQHGGFRSIDELREVNGIGDRRFADLQPLVGP